MSPTLRLRRIYDPPGPDDGLRVLVDRLWPRGVSKDRAALDLWAKDVAPTDALRRWFGHDPARFAAFRDRYRAELDGAPALDDLIRALRAAPRATLLYGAKDEEHNHAVVLLEVLRERLG